MKRIAITGGIGSGKSYVCKLLANRSINVYDCDDAAKRLMRTDRRLIGQLTTLVGDGVYANGILQKRVLASFLLASEKNKQAVDNIVHPAVAQDFLQSGLSWLESAILFESGFDRRIPFDYIVGVAAPLELRVSRVMNRDHISREKAQAWIDCQMPQEEVMRRCSFVIVNDGKEDLDEQLDKMLNSILP